MRLKVDQVHKSFKLGDREISVLRDLNFEAKSGETLAVTGPSGSGKSTLLHLIGTLDRPTSGKITIADQDAFTFSEKQLSQFRNQTIGFVFQDHHLLPQYSVLENVIIPTTAFGKTTADQKNYAHDLLDRVGLSDRANHRPAELSGGERQRVAIARALINKPDLILCDEPTGNLDHETADHVASTIFDLHREMKNIVIVVTHNRDLASKFDRNLTFREGLCIEM